MKGIINDIVTFCLLRFGEYINDRDITLADTIGKMKYGSYADKSLIHKNCYVCSCGNTSGKFVIYLSDKNHVIKNGI